MAVNPMQRKANNSFLLGMLITMLITGAIIAFLLMQLQKMKKEKQESMSQLQTVSVLANDVKSGGIISIADFKSIQIERDKIPANAIVEPGELGEYAKCDSKGRDIIRQPQQNNPTQVDYYIVLDKNNKKKLELDSEKGKYFYYTDNQATDQGTSQVTTQETTQVGGQTVSQQTTEQTANQSNRPKEYIQLDEKQIIAKIDMSTNSFVTESSITKGKFLADDERNQEYNIIALPTQIATGDYVDIRLRTPTGEDYIVATHKMVTVPDLAGVPSEN